MTISGVRKGRAEVKTLGVFRQAPRGGASAQGMTGPRASDRVFSRVDGQPREKWGVENHFAKAPAGAELTNR